MKRTPMKSRSRSIRPKLVVSAQQAVNAYVRVRDRGKPCISCGEYAELQAGHYLSTGARPDIRFEPDNIHGQCHRCNIDMAGNRKEFRLGLIDRYGLEFVERLEGFVMGQKKTQEDLRTLINTYNHLVDSLA